MTEFKDELQQLIPFIVGEIMRLDFEKDREILTGLCEQNNLLGNPGVGFMLGGAFHSLADPSYIRGRPDMKRPIHPDLLEAGEKYLHGKRTLTRDHQRLVQGLRQVTQGCQDYQDLRDMIPDTLKTTISEISSLPRTRPEGYQFNENGLQMHNFRLLSDLALHYYASKILF